MRIFCNVMLKVLCCLLSTFAHTVVVIKWMDGIDWSWGLVIGIYGVYLITALTIVAIMAEVLVAMAKKCEKVVDDKIKYLESMAKIIREK